MIKWKTLVKQLNLLKILGTLNASLPRNILAGRGLNRAGIGSVIDRAGERVLRPGFGNKKWFFNAASSFH